MRSEVIEAATGSVSMRLSPSGRYMTLYDGETTRVLDLEHDQREVFNKPVQPVGAAEDDGAIYYFEQQSDGSGWTLRSSKHASKSIDLIPPGDFHWYLTATDRSAHNVVAVFTSDPAYEYVAWAVSIDLDQFQQTAQRDLIPNRTFAADSLTTNITKQDVYWMSRGHDGKAIVAAVDAATLQERWTAELLVPNQIPPDHPSGSLVLTGDGEYLFAAVGSRRRGIPDSNGIYALRPSDGEILFGPSPEPLFDVRLQNIASMAPVPNSSSIAVLVVFNLRDHRYKFHRIRVVDVAKATITGAIDEGDDARSIAVNRAGTVLIAPAKPGQRR
ncbi:MAG: hypothetical protein Tsb0020_35800 [Haliangiales bacterium]